MGLALVAALVALVGCSSPLGGRTGDGGSGDGIELSRRVVSDPQINGIDAYGVLVPTTWRFEGVVEWRHDMANLAAAVMVAEDPTTGAALETFYPVPHAYTEPSLIPIGGNWLGSIVTPPMPASDYVAQIVVPSFRPGATIVSIEALPNVATAVAAGESTLPGGTVSVEAVRARLATTRSGSPFDEDVYVTVVYHTIGGIVQWSARHLYALRAPSGTLDAATPLLHAIASSVEPTPLWSANYQVVFDLFVQGRYQAIRSAGELSRFLAQNAEEIADIYRTAYEQQQATYDQVFDSFSEYIRGIERYSIPTVGTTQLPNNVNVCLVGNTPSVLLVPLLEVCPQNTTLLQPVR
jgi:hypothetical protein